MSRKSIAHQAVEQNQESTLEVSNDYRGQFREAAAAVLEATNVPGGPAEKSPEEQKQFKDPIAQNHERLQNAGLEDVAASVAAQAMSAAPTTKSGTSAGTVPSSKDQQAFEDQRVGEAVLSGKKRKGKGRSTTIPDSIRVLVDMLESSLSEAQVQEVLQKAIEDRSKGSVLEISKTELAETAKAIFEEIRNCLANGDLTESGRERIEGVLAEILGTQDQLVLEEDEKVWLSEQLIATGQVIERSPLDQFTQDLIGQIGEQKRAGNVSGTPSRPALIPLLEAYTVDEVIVSLTSALANEPTLTLSEVESERFAQEGFAFLVKEELASFVLESAKEDLLREVKGDSPLSIEAHLARTTCSSVFQKEYILQGIFAEQLKRQKDELRAEVLQQVEALEDEVEKIMAMSAEGARSERATLNMLLRYNDEGLSLINDTLQEKHGVTLKRQLGRIFGEKQAQQILEGLNTDQGGYRTALHARYVQLGDDEGVGITRIEQCEDFLDCFSGITAENSIRIYESLFGSVTAPLEAYSKGDVTRYHRAELALLRDGDEALKYAIEFSRYLDTQKGVIRNDPSAIAIDYAEELRKVPPQLRRDVLEHLDKTLRTNAVQSLLDSPKVKESGAALYLLGVIEEDAALQLTGQVRLAEQDIYFSYFDILALTHTAMQQELASQVASHYREHFGTDFTLNRDQRTQTWILRHEEEALISEQVQQARTLLHESVSQGTAVHAEDVLTVMSHEAALLGSEAARSALSRGELSESQKAFFQKEQEELIASALAFSASLNLDRKIVERLVSLQFKKALEEERNLLLTEKVWNQAKSYRVEGRGVGPQSLEAERESRARVEVMLEKQGLVRDSLVFDRLMQVYDKSYQHHDKLFRDMSAEARELMAISNNEEMIRFLARDQTMSEEQFDTLTATQTQQRSWGFTKTELEILDLILRSAHSEEGGAEGAIAFAKNEFWTHEWKKKAEYALNPQYAPDEVMAPAAPVNSLESDKDVLLLEKIKERDVTTVNALALREILLQRNPTCASLQFAKEHSDSLPQIIERSEELFGVQIAQLFPEDTNISIPQSDGTASTLSRNSVLHEILLSCAQLTPELQEKIKRVAETTVRGMAIQEARERVGSVESRGITKTARIQQGNQYRADELRAEREQYIQQLSMFLGEKYEARLAEGAEQALQEHVLQGVLQNCTVLDRHAVIGDYLRLDEPKHHAQRYQVGKILADVFPPDELKRWEERIETTRKDSKRKYREDKKEAWKNAESAVFEIHEAMKGGFFGFGTGEPAIRAALRNLTPEARVFASELYEVRYQETMLNHFKGEMEAEDLARVMACYQGDLALDDQYAIKEAVGSWFSKDEKVLAAIGETLFNLEEVTRSELREEAKRFSEEAKRLRALGGEANQAEAARLSSQAYRCQRAANEELRESTLLQEKVVERLQHFWKECEQTTRLGSEAVLSRLDDPDKVREMIRGIDEPDTVLAQKIEAAFKNSKVEEAATLLQEERDRHRSETLRLRLEFDSEGRIEHTIGANGETLIDGEEITVEHLRQFQLLQLHTAEDSLRGALAAGELSNEMREAARQELKDIQATRESIEKMSPEDFLAELVEEGENLVAALGGMVTDQATGAPSATLVSQFENFYSQAVLQPKYDYSSRLVDGTLYAEGSPLGAKWQARLRELEESFSNPESSFTELIESHVSNQIDKQYLSAEVSGDLDQIAATKLARGITKGEEEVITDVLFPPELTRLVSERRRVIAWYESQESLTEEQSNELQKLRDATNQILQEHVERVERRYAELSPSLPYYARDMWRGVEMRLGRATSELYRSALEKGEFSDALKLKIAMDGAGTTESLLFEGLGDPTYGTPQKSAEQIVALAEEFCALEGQEELTGKEAVQYLRECIHGELSGEEEWQADLLLVGVPETVAQMSEILTIHAKFEDSAWISTGAAWDRFEESKKAFDDILKELTPAERKSVSEEELRLRLGEERYNELFIHFEAAANSADIGNQERRAIADLTVNTISTVGVIAGGVLVTWGTAGLGTAGYLAAVGGSLVTVRTGLSYAMKGNSYSGSEALMDTGMAVVDTASLGAGILISKGVSKATTSIINRVAARQAARSTVSQSQGVSLRLVGGAGEEVVERGLASRIGGVALNATKATGRGLAKTSVIAGEGAIDGAVDGLLVGMYMQGVSEENWNDGFFTGLNNMLSSGTQMAAHGAVIGVVAAPTLVGVGKVGGAAWKKIRGKNSTPDADLATHVDQVRARREEVIQRAEQQLHESSARSPQESDVARHLSDGADDAPPIYSFQDAQNAARRNGSEVTDEAIADFYQRLDGEVPAGGVGEPRVSGDALEREIHEAWQRADDEGLSGGAETFSGPTGGSPSGGSASHGSGGRSTVSETPPVDSVRRESTSQPSSPTRSNSGSSNSPQARVEGAEEGASVAVLEPPHVKQEVELTEDELLNFEKMKEQFERQVAEETAVRSARQTEPNGVGSSSPRGRGSSPTSPSRGDVPPSQTRQDIQQIREDSKRYVSTTSSAVKVESSPAQAPATHELKLVRPAEVEVPTTRPVEAPEPRRVPETAPEVVPHTRPVEQPSVRPAEAPQPMRSPEVKVHVGPLHRPLQELNPELSPFTRPYESHSPRPSPEVKTRPSTKAKTKRRLRRVYGPELGQGNWKMYESKLPQNGGFLVISRPLHYQYVGPVDLHLRKRTVEKIKGFFGEVDVLKWSLPIY